MKNLLIIAIVLFSVSLSAQQKSRDKDGPRQEMREKIKDLNPEQVAELRTKQLTLKLDLTEAQQKAVKELELERATKRKESFENKKERKELTSEELFQRKSEMLDDKLAVKAKMKSILTEEQFEKWERASHHRQRKMRKKGARRAPSKNNP